MNDSSEVTSTGPPARVADARETPARGGTAAGSEPAEGGGSARPGGVRRGGIWPALVAIAAIVSSVSESDAEARSNTNLIPTCDNGGGSGGRSEGILIDNSPYAPSTEGYFRVSFWGCFDASSRAG
jgi:hypothetical protein